MKNLKIIFILKSLIDEIEMLDCDREKIYYHSNES